MRLSASFTLTSMTRAGDSARDLLARGQEAFGMIELDDGVAAIDLLHHTAHEDADLVGVLLEHAVALRLAHALDQHLLRGLDRVAAELGDRQRKAEHVARL